MSKRLASFLIHLELIVMALIVLVPISWIILSSFNAGDGLAATSFIPQSLTLHNYVRLFTDYNYGLWFMNTFEIAVLTAATSVIVITITAWIFSRFHFRGRRGGLMSLLLLSMFPTFLSMTAYFTLFLNFGLLNQPIALVIIYLAAGIPYNVWLVKGYLDGISKDIDEAAYIDGCGHFGTFFKIIFPLSKPIITYCAVSQFMVPWMDYILPNMLLSNDRQMTLAVGLFKMITGKENNTFTTFAAGSMLIAIPITISFLIFQKYLVQGVAAGANKE